MDNCARLLLPSWCMLLRNVKCCSSLLSSSFSLFKEQSKAPSIFTASPWRTSCCEIQEHERFSGLDLGRALQYPAEKNLTGDRLLSVHWWSEVAHKSFIWEQRCWSSEQGGGGGVDVWIGAEWEQGRRCPGWKSTTESGLKGYRRRKLGWHRFQIEVIAGARKRLTLMDSW